MHEAIEPLRAPLSFIISASSAGQPTVLHQGRADLKSLLVLLGGSQLRDSTFNTPAAASLILPPGAKTLINNEHLKCL